MAAPRQFYANPYRGPQQQTYDNSRLPEGWEMLTDTKTGWPYFIDHIKKMTTWQDPRKKSMPDIPQYPGYQQHPYPDYEDSSTGRLREIPVIHESSQPNQNYPSPAGVQGPSQPRTDMPQPRTDTPPKQSQMYNVQQPERMSQGRSSPLTQQGRSSPKVREIPVRHVGPAEQQVYPPQGTMPGGPYHQQYPQQGPYPEYPPQQVPYPQQGGGYPPQQSAAYPPPPQGYQRPVATYQQGPYPDMSEQSRQGGYPEQGYPYSSSSQGVYPPPTSQQGPGSERIIPIQRMSGTQPSAPVDPRPDYPGHNLQQPVSGQGKSGPQTTHAQTTHQQPYSGPQQPSSEQQQQYRASPTLTKQEGIGGDTTPSEAEPRERPVPSPRKKTQMEIIEAVSQEVASFQESVNVFSGTKSDKQYKYLEEMLTRNLLKLDDIIAGDNEDIRMARRLAVKEITASLDQLELKAFAVESEQTDTNSSKSVEEMDTGNSDSRSKEEGKTKDPSRVSEMVLNSEISC